MVTKNQKIKIVKAYLDKSIDKEEMKFLFDHGITMPPIQWQDEDDKKYEKKRELIEKVFGVTMQKVEWD